MASRYVFLAALNSEILFEMKCIDFVWNKGMSFQQKQKNVTALHQAAQNHGIINLLEVSTKSTVPLGKLLSAFNLKFHHGSIQSNVESAYQGSKVFRFGGPYTDIYYKQGYEAKKDERLRNSGDLIGFSLDGVDWGLEPGTSFYDWLYINALYQDSHLYEQILDYNGFTDIEFNHAKSLSCQARSCALFVSLFKADKLKTALSGKNEFLDVLGSTYSRSQSILGYEEIDKHMPKPDTKVSGVNQLSQPFDERLIDLLTEKALTAKQICVGLDCDWTSKRMANYLSKRNDITILIQTGKANRYRRKDAVDTQTEVPLGI